MLAGLRAAHAAGIVHRDVKPANILVGPDDRAVLTDFGIARAADSATLTNAGDLIGSPSYIAPERARGQAVRRRRATCGGSAPRSTRRWRGGRRSTVTHALATLTAVVADEPDPATHAGPLWPVISALLSKDPDGRPDAAEVERMLRECRQRGEHPRDRGTSNAPGSRAGGRPGSPPRSRQPPEPGKRDTTPAADRPRPAPPAAA